MSEEILHYEYRCRSGHRFTRFDTVANHQSLRLCPTCFGASTQIITTPSMVKVAKNNSVAGDSKVRIVETSVLRMGEDGIPYRMKMIAEVLVP